MINYVLSSRFSWLFIYYINIPHILVYNNMKWTDSNDDGDGAAVGIDRQLVLPIGFMEFFPVSRTTAIIVMSIHAPAAVTAVSCFSFFYSNV
jgi:hypothetical protein